jgi:hypothetical protein
MVAMASPPPSRNVNDATCWQCGAPARAECAYSFELVADPHRGLVTLGYRLISGTFQNRLKVLVPRCANCRFRSWLSTIIVLGSAGVGALVAPVVQSRFGPTIESAIHLPVNLDGTKDAAAGIGAVLGFVAASLSIAVRRWRSGRRAVDTYPPLVKLQQAGWRLPD